jgi:16S rRNA (adenine1518-N6/adenine1519-N6)-dimethyltransferase
MVYNTTSSTYADGPITVNTVGKVVLTAPLSGTYQGMNFFQNRSMTQPLSVTAEKLVAIEIDPVAISALSETAPSATVRLVDVLEADLPSILEELPTPRALVSNMPYNITGPLLTAFAEAKEHFDVAVLMMQKEVGERVLAQPGTRECGSLSIAMQAQFNIEKVCNAPGGAFFPPPKVDSVVLQFTPVPLGLDRSQAGSFFKLVRSGFVQPRKTLLNNLLASGWSKHSAEEALRALGLALSIRPHQLGLEEWKRLSLFPLS